ncbi:MAG TPA: hypothetical protein VIN61_15790 [Gammaproteobacteria bacterium]
MPYSRELASREAPSAIAMPATTPRLASHRLRSTTMDATRAGRAPSATRTPISCVRRAT